MSAHNLPYEQRQATYDVRNRDIEIGRVVLDDGTEIAAELWTTGTISAGATATAMVGYQVDTGSDPGVTLYRADPSNGQWVAVPTS